MIDVSAAVEFDGLANRDHARHILFLFRLVILFYGSIEVLYIALMVLCVVNSMISAEMTGSKALKS